MKALLFLEPGLLELRSIPIPRPKEDEVLLKVILAGICQTDVEIFNGHYPVKGPRILGHEFVGEIVEAGEPDLPVGTRVAVYPPIFCGTCIECQRGNFRHCLNFRCLGNTFNGGWAEYVAVCRAQIFPIDPALTEASVWLEPLACVLHALSTFPPAFRGSALVLGGGSMGMLFLQAIKTLFGTRVAVADPHASRLELATRLGAENIVLLQRDEPQHIDKGSIKGFAPAGFDMIIDTTGSADLLETWLPFAGSRCQVIEFGVPVPSAQLTIPLSRLFSREISISGSVGNDIKSFLQGLDLIKNKNIHTSELVEKKIALEEVPQVLLERSLPVPKGKILIDFSMNN